jgi:hypothetical protein
MRMTTLRKINWFKKGCRAHVKMGDGDCGALTIRPPTNWPRDISTQTTCPPCKLSAVTIYYYDLSQSGRIVRPHQIMTFWPSKFGQFVIIFCPNICDIFSMYFSSNFALKFLPNITKGPFFQKWCHFAHFYMAHSTLIQGLVHFCSVWLTIPRVRIG